MRPRRQLTLALGLAAVLALAACATGTAESASTSEARSTVVTTVDTSWGTVAVPTSRLRRSASTPPTWTC